MDTEKQGGGILIELNVRPGFSQINLPRGYVDHDNKLHKYVVVKEMSGPEEEALASMAKEAIQNSVGINQILTGTIVSIGDVTDRSFIRRAVKEMCAGDRIAIFVGVIVISNEDETYGFDVVCSNPKCDRGKNKIADRVDIDLKTIEPIVPEEPFKVEYTDELPANGLFQKAKWHILTGEREKIIEDVQRQFPGTGELTLHILSRVISFDDKQLSFESKKDIQEAIEVVMRLRKRDRDRLRKAFLRDNAGLDMTFDYCCDVCGKQERLPIPLNKDFFLPSAT